jgi:PAS domain S-box-containing protein
MPNRNHHPSLANRLISRLSFAIGMVSIVACSVLVVLTARSEQATLENDADLAIQHLVGTLERPLWDLDQGHIGSIGETFARNRLISSLIVHGEDGEVLYAFRRQDDHAGVVRESAIMHQGMRIGRVEVGFTESIYHEHIWRIIQFTLLMVALILVIVHLLTGYLVRKLLQAPLVRFSRMVTAYADGGDPAEAAQEPYGEFRQFEATLSTMGGRIRDQLQQLRTLNASLAQKNESLIATEEELRDSEYRLRSISGNFTAGMIYQVVISPAGARSFTYLSDSVKQLYGVTPAEGLADAELIYGRIHPDDRGRLAEAEAEANRTLSPFRAEVRIIDHAGALRWSSLASTPQRLENGSVRWDGIEFVITERKRAEAELIRYRDQLEATVAERTRELEAAKNAANAANQAKSAFLASMSHEIRTPLNAVLGYAQVLGRSSTISDQHRRAVEVISRSGEHLLQLINDILEMSRIEAGRSGCEPEDFDLHALLDGLRSLFLQRCTDKGIGFQLALSGELPRYIRADQRKVRQILINLLSNAVKFTARGQVELGAAMHDGQLALQVRDTGSGIAPDELSQLFRPFVQSHAVRRSGEGTGLGLAISLGFARLMAGTLTAESVSGRGSTFTLVLPVTVAATAPPTRTYREVVGPAPGQRAPEILVAEDHAESRALLVDLLRMAGCMVEAAEDGAAALAACARRRFDLVWMDIDMPVMDGLAATAAIRALPGAPPVIVALTASAFLEDRERILAAGCAEVAHKPFQSEFLFETMERLLGIRFTWSDAPPAATGKASPSAEELSRALAAVPDPERAELVQAVIVGDVDACLRLLAAWPDRALAEALAAMLSSYAFERVEALLLSVAVPRPAHDA